MARHRGNLGLSLLELLAVVLVLGILAAIVQPSLEPATPARLALAASEVASAARFARSEALRTGQPHGIRAQSSLDLVRVFRADTTSTPLTPAYDVRHPVSMRLYDLELPGVDLTETSVWRGTCNVADQVVFDARGTARCADPFSVLLDQQTLGLSAAGQNADVTIEGLTGRVVVP